MTITTRKRAHDEAEASSTTSITTNSAEVPSKRLQSLELPRVKGKAEPKSQMSIASQLSSNDIVTLDDMYDLTLIVGTKEEHGGIKAFRINSGSLRMASQPFKTMLSGRYIESTKSEIAFPADSPNPFLLVIRIIHLRLHELPMNLTKTELVDLAIFCDKYLLTDLIAPFLKVKDWLAPHKSGNYFKRDADLQDWALFTYYFKLDQDCEYLISALAMSVCVDPTTLELYYVHGSQKIALRDDLPSGLLDRIRLTRSAILDEVLRTCNTALATAIARKTCDAGRTANCAALRIGIIIMVFQPVDLYPTHENASTMYNNVFTYWEAVSDLYTKHWFGSDHPSHAYKYSYRKCIGNLGFGETIKTTVLKHIHVSFWEELKTTGYI